jgi:hypothetical protein
VSAPHPTFSLRNPWRRHAVLIECFVACVWAVGLSVGALALLTALFGLITETFRGLSFSPSFNRAELHDDHLALRLFTLPWTTLRIAYTQIASIGDHRDIRSRKPRLAFLAVPTGNVDILLTEPLWLDTQPASILDVSGSDQRMSKLVCLDVIDRDSFVDVLSERVSRASRVAGEAEARSSPAC